MEIRSPAVADMFYPGDPGELHAMVRSFFGHTRVTGGRPKVIVSPHAGYVYSGLTAAHAYKQLEPWADSIKRVVLFGPSHRVALQGLAVPASDCFRTPLGDIPLDRPSIDSITDFPQVTVSDLAHLEEHSLEVQLPFLQEVLDDFTLIPIVVGWADPPAVAEVIETLWGGDETIIVISSDLSHYHDYATALRIDRQTSDRIEAMDVELLTPEMACGCHALSGLLYAARQHNMKITRLDLRNSGDTAGSKDRVVGYGAWMLEE